MTRLILGIEFGSTRIKSVLTDQDAVVLAVGTSEWENEYIGGHWSYPLDKVRSGLQNSYKNLVKSYGKPITKLDALGISAMMHGYLAFDENWNLLEPFRTWRDTTTSQASQILMEKLRCNMPQRWSATHYYQAVLNKEATVSKIAHLTTLAGYVHFLLTGKNVLGANDASGMFPLVDKSWDLERIEAFNKLIDVDFKSLLPEVMLAGERGGTLSREGALLLDPTGQLKEGALLCPPEGDMGTGMVCTNAVRPSTAQVSSGTSANMSVVLEKPLKNYYKQIDVIATPDGHPAVLIHTNNCANEIHEWVNLFEEVIDLCGCRIDKGELFNKLFLKASESDGEIGKLVGYNFVGGEPLAETIKGAPMILRDCDGKINLADFMQMQIYSAVDTLSLGMEILKKEGVKITSVTAHGGYYKTPKVGQIATSAALDAPVTVLGQAGEGGAYGVALLAGFCLQSDLNLQEFLDKMLISKGNLTLSADEKEKAKYNAFYTRYKKYLQIEKSASKVQ